MIQTQYSLLDGWHERIPYGQSIEVWLGEVHTKYAQIVSAPVVKPADKNQKLLKNTTSVCSENSGIQALVYPLSST